VRLPAESIRVRHNVEMAHRLWLTPGKCEKIHGHSWDVQMSLFGETSPAGMLAGLDFADVKQLFRGYLDGTYDHYLLLNADDPWAQVQLPGLGPLPGLQPFAGDPTTENLAAVVGGWAVGTFAGCGITRVQIQVMETRVNGATWDGAV
jgi:6-pyruvoyltetrahydropterin/6-carboxytetrahydropterin synthase